MKGIELAERFYLEYGAPMIREKFSEIESALAVGIAGSGSECFGYDDETSRDHDFEAGFCKEGMRPVTFVTKEYPSVWKRGLEPFYPINDEKNNLKTFSKISCLIQF